MKQHSQATYLGCVMGETVSGEALVLIIINEINEKLEFLYRKHLGFEECYIMTSYNHILNIHAPLGALTLM